MIELKKLPSDKKNNNFFPPISNDTNNSFLADKLNSNQASVLAENNELLQKKSLSNEGEIENSIPENTQNEENKNRAKKSLNVITKSDRSPEGLSPQIPSASKIISPSLRKMFGVLGNLGKGIKKNLTVISGFGINTVASNLLKIQEKLNFLRNKSNEVLTEKERKVLLMKKNLRNTDTVASALALVNAALSYYENEVFYSMITDPNDESIIIKGRNESNAAVTALRMIIMVMTIALLVCVYLHYHFNLKILKIKQLRLKEDTLYTSGLVPRLSLELFICSIWCPPYFDFTIEGTMLAGKYTYSYDAIINVITLFKSYLLVRLFHHYTPWTNENAIKACKKAKCQAGFSFALKCELKKRPYLMIGILMVATVLYLGLAMRTFEISYLPNQNSGGSFDFSYLANSMWLIIITMTTVGFGEGYPSTHLGRFIGVIACIIGMLLVSLMVVSLTVSSELTPEENKAFFILKKIHAADNSKNKAANIIKTLFKLRETMQRKDSESVTQRFVWIAKLKKNIAIFKNDYKVADTSNIPVDEMLKNLQDKLKTDISDIKKELKDSKEIEKKCHDMKVGQLNISERLENISKMQNVIADYVISLNTFLEKQF